MPLERNTEAVLDALVSGSSIGLIVLDEHAAVESWSPGAERIFGWSEAEVVGHRNPSVPPEDEPFSQELRRRTLAGESLAGIELTRRRKDGSSVEIVLHTAPLPGSRRIAVLVEDATARKRAHVALADSERRYRDLVNSLDAIVWECDATLRFSFVSERAEAILGYPVADWLAQTVWPAKIHPDDLWAESACLDEMRAGRDHELEYRMIAADGRTVWLHDLVRVERDESGRPGRMRGVMVDVTKQREAEAALRASEASQRASQRLESVGRLAGGIAHDFNNLLLAISGYGELALAELAEREPGARDSLQEILRAADRAASLTGQLLAFSRKQLLQPAVVDVNEIVAAAEGMLGRLIGEDVVIETRLEAALPAVMADATQLEQVLVNLVLNARDAMLEGGTVGIATSVTQLEPDAALPLGIEPGAYACIAVSDTGCGIDDETRAHLFEPFFTTKPPGRGTGLGLATVYGIVSQSGGAVTVESTVGEGSCFRVLLPTETAPAEPAEERADGILHGSGKVLLVEDEDIVRGLVQEMLVRAGYEVVACGCPHEALEAGTDVDVLLTDVVMPGMSGRALAERLHERRPDLKVLYVSGHTSDAVLARGVHDKSAAFLQKPFTHAELTRKLADVLAR